MNPLEMPQGILGFIAPEFDHMPVITRQNRRVHLFWPRRAALQISDPTAWKLPAALTTTGT